MDGWMAGMQVSSFPPPPPPPPSSGEVGGTMPAANETATPEPNPWRWSSPVSSIASQPLKRSIPTGRGLRGTLGQRVGRVCPLWGERGGPPVKCVRVMVCAVAA